MSSIAQSIEAIGRMSMALIMDQEIPEPIHHFTNEDYRKIAKAIFKESTDDDFETITIFDAIPGVDMTVKHWVSGYWTTGGSDDWGRKERVWVPTKHDYEIESFEMFDKNDDDRPNDFNRGILEAILNS